MNGHWVIQTLGLGWTLALGSWMDIGLYGHWLILTLCQKDIGSWMDIGSFETLVNMDIESDGHWVLLGFWIMENGIGTLGLGSTLSNSLICDCIFKYVAGYSNM